MRKIYDGNIYFNLCNHPMTPNTLALTEDRCTFQKRLESMFKPRNLN